MFEPFRSFFLGIVAISDLSLSSFNEMLFEKLVDDNSAISKYK